jgi:hypothetical protein
MRGPFYLCGSLFLSDYGLLASAVMRSAGI